MLDDFTYGEKGITLINQQQAAQMPLRAFWNFGFYHDRDSMSEMTGVSFPIWCLLVPCNIAPILWLRKRRRLQTPGFPVEPASSDDSVKSASSV